MSTYSHFFKLLIRDQNVANFLTLSRFQRTGYLTRDMETLYDLTRHAIRLPFHVHEVRSCTEE